jgi:hypothetical protein
MAVRPGLKESLQEISALIGLLRSDLIELSEAPLRRGAHSTVVSHMNWIADRLDEMGPALAAGLDRRSPQAGKSVRRRASADRLRSVAKGRPIQPRAKTSATVAPAEDKAGQDRSSNDNPDPEEASLDKAAISKPSDEAPRPEATETERPDASSADGTGPTARDES